MVPSGPNLEWFICKGSIYRPLDRLRDSVGMLMWEIFSGHPPFDDRPHDHNLIFDICEGLRPPILPEMPQDYVEMMQKCWDVDPSKRPTIGELWDFSFSKLEEIYKTKNSKDH